MILYLRPCPCLKLAFPSPYAPVSIWAPEGSAARAFERIYRDFIITVGKKGELSPRLGAGRISFRQVFFGKEVERVCTLNVHLLHYVLEIGDSPSRIGRSSTRLKQTSTPKPRKTVLFVWRLLSGLENWGAQDDGSYLRLCWRTYVSNLFLNLTRTLA